MEYGSSGAAVVEGTITSCLPAKGLDKILCLASSSVSTRIIHSSENTGKRRNYIHI